MPSSRGSSQSRDQAQVSHIAGRFFTIWATNNEEFQDRFFFFPSVQGWAFCNEPRRQILESLKLKPQNQTQQLSGGQKALLLLRQATNGSPTELQERICFCQDRAVTWDGHKVAGLFGDGADDSYTPISGGAQRARCGKVLSLCRDCVMDTRPPPASLLSGLQAVSRIHPTRFLGGGRGKSGGG